MNKLNISHLKSNKYIIFAAVLLISVAVYGFGAIMSNQVIAIDEVEDFEKTISNRDFWAFGENATFSQTNSTNEAFSGKRALKIASNSTAMTRWLTRIEKYPATPGQKIHAEVYLKAINATGRGSLAVSFFKDKGNGSWRDAWLLTASSAASVTGTSNWRKVDLNIEVPQGAKFVRYEFRLNNRGTLLIDDFKIIDTGKNLGINNGNTNLQVYEGIGKVGEEWGAQVVLGDTYFMWVDSACKANLAMDGNPLSTKNYREIDDQYQQIRTGLLNCSEVRTFSDLSLIEQRRKDSGGTAPNTGAPAEVISKEPPPMVNSGAISYTNVNQFNTSVIPTDPVIRTSLHGINLGRGQQLFTIDCLHSHYRNDDPIVFPGQFGASHNHEFFGDTQLNARSTVDTIINNSANTCRVGADRSAYWTPTAFQNGKPLVADNNKFYYKVGQVDSRTIVPMPVGLKMIAGNAMATGPQSPQVTYLFTTTSQGKHTAPTTQSTKTGRMFQTKSGENGVRLQIQFPQCWDGKHLWLPNSTHMAYPVQGKCPATHPKAFLQLMFNLGYSDATGGDGFRFSSGEWFTAHADFINGWKPEPFDRLVQTCIRERRYCGMTRSDSEGRTCTQRNLTNQGCIEFRAGETAPRFFGKVFN